MRYLALVIVSIVLVLPGETNAQFRGSRSGGGWMSGNPRWNTSNSWNNGNGWNGIRGYYGDQNYNSGYRSYPSGSWGMGLGNYGYSSYPGYYNQSAPGYYSQSAPGYYNQPAPRTSFYFDSNTSEIAGVGSPLIPNSAINLARVEVRVFDPRDDVYVQGQLMPGHGVVRQFVSPELTVGKNYQYMLTLRRVGLQSNRDEEQRTVNVQANSNVIVDFTQTVSNRMPTPSTGASSVPLPR